MGFSYDHVICSSKLYVLIWFGLNQRLKMFELHPIFCFLYECIGEGEGAGDVLVVVVELLDNAPLP
jgi:hypothetical protein